MTGLEGSGSGLTPEIIDKMRQVVNPETGKRWTQTEIGAEYGVTRGRVSQIKRADPGFWKSPQDKLRERVDAAWPWSVPTALGQASICRLLRDHAEYMMGAGSDMSPDALFRLKSFYRKLKSDDLVVEFDPTIPPGPDSKQGGWTYRDRVTRDKHLIIRVNEYTRLTPFGEVVWSFPTREPRVLGSGQAEADH